MLGDVDAGLSRVCSSDTFCLDGKLDVVQLTFVEVFKMTGTGADEDVALPLLLPLGVIASLLLEFVEGVVIIFVFVVVVAEEVAFEVILGDVAAGFFNYLL